MDSHNQVKRTLVLFPYDNLYLAVKSGCKLLLFILHIVRKWDFSCYSLIRLVNYDKVCILWFKPKKYVFSGLDQKNWYVVGGLR